MGRFVKIAIAGVIILAILMVFSTNGIRAMENWARQRPDTSVGQSLPYTLGTLAYYTLRYSLAKDIYETNIETWPDHPRNVDAEFRIALCHEKLGEYAEAVRAFDAFALEHPEDSRADAARGRSGKIKSVQLNQPFGE